MGKIQGRTLHPKLAETRNRNIKTVFRMAEALGADGTAVKDGKDGRCRKSEKIYEGEGACRKETGREEDAGNKDDGEANLGKENRSEEIAISNSGKAVHGEGMGTVRAGEEGRIKLFKRRSEI